MPNLYLVDGSHMGFRATCAFPTLTLQDGSPISAVYGVVTMLLKLIENFSPGVVVVAFDMASSKYRKGLHPGYKAGRSQTAIGLANRERFLEQRPALIDLLRLMGFIVLAEQTAGYEADDCIAYCASKVDGGDHTIPMGVYKKAIVVSSDMDLVQLVQHDGVSFYDPMNDKSISYKNFAEETELRPDQWLDYKLLIGDQSDNIPHPAGVSKITAKKLLREYGSLEELIKVRHTKIEPFLPQIPFVQDLITLNLHERFPKEPVWATIDKEFSAPRYLSPDLYDIFEQLEFQSLLGRWNAILPLLKAYQEAK